MSNQFIFANNVSTILSAAATSSQTTLTLSSVANIPTSFPTGGYFPLTLNDAATRQVFEIVYVTAPPSGNNVTVLRGQEGTSAASWNIGDYAYSSPTAAWANLFGTPPAFIVGSARGLIGSSAGSVMTASWTAQELIAETALGGTAFKGANLSLSFNGSTTGAGGMDTGSMPTSANLSVYAIYSPGSNTWNTLGTAGSTSDGPVYTGSNMPSGYSASALIWAGVTGGTSDFRQFQQIDRTVVIPDNTVGSSLSDTSYTSLSLGPAGIPSVATFWYPKVGTTTAYGIALSPSSTGAVGVVGSLGGGGLQLAPNKVMIVTAQTTYYKVNGGSDWAVIAFGYEF